MRERNKPGAPHYFSDLRNRCCPPLFFAYCYLSYSTKQLLYVESDYLFSTTRVSGGGGGCRDLQLKRGVVR